MRLLNYLLLLIFSASFVSATPLVLDFDGSLEHGSSVLISGSNFGQKIPAKPYLWAPFDVDEQPSDLGLVTQWSALNSMVWTPNEGTNNEGGLKASDGQGIWTASVVAENFAWNDYDQQMYLFQKGKRNFPYRNLDQFNDVIELNQNDFSNWPNINWKTWRLWNLDWSQYALLGAWNGAFGASGPDGSISSSCYGDPELMDAGVGEWYTQEFIVQSNSQTTSAVGVHGDGYFAHYVNGVLAAKAPYFNYDYNPPSPRYWKMRDVETDDYVNNFFIHAVKANAQFPNHWRYWADDVYVDTTWSRVMIGNQPTLEQSTHREPQIPVLWDDNNVEVQVNLGSFSQEEIDGGLYLFVVDENGNVSEGFLLEQNVPSVPFILEVSGDFVNDNTITISGSGFGRKDPALPFFYDNFESGIPGETLRGTPLNGPLNFDGPGHPTIGNYSYIAPNIVYTDEGVYSGTRSAYEHVFDYHNGFSSRWSWDNNITNAESSFSSMVIKFKSSHGTLEEYDGSSLSSKMLRLNTWPDDWHQYGDPSIWIGTGIRSVNGENHNVLIPSVNGETTAGGNWFNNIAPPEFDDPNNEFFSISIWTVMGDRGISNGMAGRDFNGNTVQVDNVLTLLTDHDFEGTRNAYFNGHVNPYDGSLEYWIDEAYADTTLARVITRVPGEGATGPVAMQIPITWSDNEIVFQVNTGQYLPGTELELLVWNANGNVSEGFTVVVGENNLSNPYDLNQDAVVSILDLLILVENFGYSSVYDLNNGNVINIVDLLILINNFD